MAIPSTGPILLANTIQDEFGGANPASLSEYYAGGTYVPSGTTGDGGPIPSSGQISFSDFYGASAELVYLETVSGSATSSGRVLSQVVITWGANGSYYGSHIPLASGSTTAPFNWLLSGSASDYDIRFTTTGGAGTVANNVWQNLSSDRSASVDEGQFLQINVDIRATANGTILASNTATIQAFIE